MKKSLTILFILLLSFSFVSAGLLSDFLDLFRPEIELSPVLDSSYYDGLPTDFEPVLAYTHNWNRNGQTASLWDGNGRVFGRTSARSFREFTDDDKGAWNLGGFNAVVGYSHMFNGPDREIISLWDAEGNNKFSAKGDNTFRDFTLRDKREWGLEDFIPVLGYTHFLGGLDRERISLWDVNGNVKGSTRGDTTFRNYEGDEREEQGLGDFMAVKGYYIPNGNTIFLWDGTGNIVRWDWGEGRVVGEVPIDLPSGVPDAVYYDWDAERVVAWFGSTAYQSIDGINFEEIEREVGVIEEDRGEVGVGTDKGINRCELIPEIGPCKGSISKYYFDSDSRTCEEFRWGGCGGVVPFDSLEECGGSCVTGDEIIGDFFEDYFEDGDAEGWEFNENNWEVIQDPNSVSNYLLRGREHGFIERSENPPWARVDSLGVDVRLIEGGVHLNFRISDTGRYFIGIREDEIHLSKSILKDNFGEFEDPFEHVRLETIEAPIGFDQWYNVEIKSERNSIQIYLDDELKMEYEDDDILISGGIAFESLENSEIYLDDVVARGNFVQKVWSETWGPENGISMFLELKESDRNVLYAAPYDGGLYQTRDRGTSWQRLENGIDMIRPYAISLVMAPSNDDLVYYTAGNKIFRSEDNGESWNKMPFFMEYYSFFDGLGIEQGDGVHIALTVHPFNQDKIYAGTEGNGIWVSEEGGGNWEQLLEGLERVNPECTGNMREFRGCEPKLPYPMIRSIKIALDNPEVIYTSTQGDGVYKSINGGTSWISKNNGLSDYFVHTLELTSDSDVLYAITGHKRWNVLEGGSLLKTTNGGNEWREVIINNLLVNERVTVVQVDTRDDNIIYVGTTESNFYQSLDGGENWIKLNDNPITNRQINNIVIDSVNSLIYVGTAGQGYFKSFDDGESWLKINSGLSGSPLSAIGIHPTNPNIVYIGDDVGIYKAVDGQTWVEIATNIPGVNDIVVNPLDPEIVYTALDGGVLRSEDQGISWSYLIDGMSEDDPIYALAIDPTDPEIIYAGKGVPWNSEIGGSVYKLGGNQVWNNILDIDVPVTTIAIAPANPDIIYVGTYGEGMFKSENKGSSWDQINNGLDYSNIYALAIDPLDENIVYVGGMGLFAGDFGFTSDEIFFKTIDGGESWFVPTSSSENFGAGVEKIIIDPREPNKIYVGTHGAGVFQSGDSGNTLTRMNGGYLQLDSTTYDHVYVYDLEIDATGDVLYAGSCGRGAFRGLPNTIDPCNGGGCEVEPTLNSKQAFNCDNDGICELGLGEDIENCQNDCSVMEIDARQSVATKTHTHYDDIDTDIFLKADFRETIAETSQESISKSWWCFIPWNWENPQCVG